MMASCLHLVALMTVARQASCIDLHAGGTRPTRKLSGEYRLKESRKARSHVLAQEGRRSASRAQGEGRCPGSSLRRAVRTLLGGRGWRGRARRGGRRGRGGLGWCRGRWGRGGGRGTGRWGHWG